MLVGGMPISNWGIHNVPKDVILSLAPKVEKVKSMNITPETDAPLTEEQIFLRALRREFGRHQPLPASDFYGNKIDWNTTKIIPMKYGDGSTVPNIDLSTPKDMPTLSGTLRPTDYLSGQAENHHLFHLAKSWLRQAEILSNMQ